MRRTRLTFASSWPYRCSFCRRVTGAPVVSYLHASPSHPLSPPGNAKTQAPGPTPCAALSLSPLWFNSLVSVSIATVQAPTPQSRRVPAFASGPTPLAPRPLHSKLYPASRLLCSEQTPRRLSYCEEMGAQARKGRFLSSSHGPPRLALATSRLRFYDSDSELLYCIKELVTYRAIFAGVHL